MEIIIRSGGRETRVTGAAFFAALLFFFLLVTYGESAIDGFLDGISGAAPAPHSTGPSR